jgi:primosomal protein N' (replication factor Y)
METPPVLRVAIPAPLYSLFDYLPPEDVEINQISPGSRVKVPFGRGKRVGVVLDNQARCDPALLNKLKRSEALLDREPLLSGETLALLQWAADYYRHPPGEVICAALPARLREGKAPLEHRMLLLRATHSDAPPGSGLGRAPRQQRIHQLLKEEGPLGEEILRERLGECRAPLKALLDKGLVERVEVEQLPASPTTPALALNSQQQQALATIVEQLGRFQALLLDGVTGSGKTEVYLQATQEALTRGGQVLILVPEIGLTPQLLRRFRRRIAAPIALLHSGLAAGERESAWHQARLARARVVIGTRSAIFTPMPELALILVDEEHDLSYKQQEGFRYSARDLAVVRASRIGCPVVLGSATPSLESLHNANSGRYQALHLNRRAGEARAPTLELTDIRSRKLEAGLSPPLLQAVGETLAQGNQTLLFLNRRGYAPLMVCRDCGWFLQCQRCDARMTLHLGLNLLWCHHCGSQRRPDPRCPDCGGEAVEPAGQGTERLEQTLARRFPDTSVIRIDRDSTSRKGSFEKRLEEIRQGDASILVGTQMLAKGHHFPSVTLVGILDVDQGFYGTDYHAMERMAQTIVQVAGRAGRAEQPGRVLLQTRHPDHPLLETLLRKGYREFAQEALHERKLAALPPYRFQALLRAEAHHPEPPRQFLDQVRQHLLADGLQHIEVLGPIPAPMEKRAGRFRAHLLLQSPNRSRLQQLLAAKIPEIARFKGVGKVRWSIDIDPQEMA